MSEDTSGARRRPTLPGTAFLATLAGGVLLVAACGGGGSQAATGLTAYQKTLAYSQCMRAHGEPGFPDPQPNGNLIIQGPKDHLNGALMNSANRACQHLLPKFRPLTAAQQRRATVEALRFVACMRAHGLPNMPDPVVNSQGISIRISGKPGSGLGPGSQVFQSAQRACQKLIPGGPP
jgi:hypothetical protein